MRGKKIDDCLLEIFAKQQHSEATVRMRTYKSRFFKDGLPYRTKIKILQENGYIKSQEELWIN